MTVENFLQKHAKKLTKNNGGWICCCLFPNHRDSTPSLHVSWEGLYFCWGCGKKGSFASLLHDIEGYSWAKAIEHANLVSKTNLTNSLDKIKLKDDEDQPKRLSKGFLGLFDVNWEEGYARYQHAVENEHAALFPPWTFPFFKGFTAETLRKFQAGYDETKQRLIIPVFDDDEDLRGFIGRSCTESFPKYLIYPPLRTALHLYNERSIGMFEHFKDTVILVEGPLDVWWFSQQCVGIPTVSLFTSKVSDTQARNLLARGLTCVLMFDGDNAGRKGALEVAQKLLAYGGKVDIAMNFPKGVENIKTLTLKQILDAFHTRKPFPAISAYNMLRSETRK